MAIFIGRAQILMIGVLGLLWGLNWPAVKFMLNELPPLTIRAIAFLFAASCLALIAKARGERLSPQPQELPLMAITGLLVVFGFNVLTAFGQLATETASAAIIAFTMPAMNAVLAGLLLGEKLERQHIAALGLSLFGLAVLASEDFTQFLLDPIGPLIMLAAALSWALGNVALKSRRWSLSALPLTVWFFIISSLLTWPLVLVFEPPWEQSLPSIPVLAALLYHALGPMVICYWLWTVLVEQLSSTIAAIATLLTPLVGVTSAALFLGNELTAEKIVALIMILASIALALIYRPSGAGIR